VRAGHDTADWAHDRPDIRARIRHQLADVATSYDLSDARYNYNGHTYVAAFVLPEKAAIVRAEIELVPQSSSQNLVMTVFRVSLVDLSQGKTYPLNRDSAVSKAYRLKQNRVGKRRALATRGAIALCRYLRECPGTAARMAGGRCARARRRGDATGRSHGFSARWIQMDPLRTALVESGPPNGLANGAADGQAEITGTSKPGEFENSLQR